MFAQVPGANMLRAPGSGSGGMDDELATSAVRAPRKFKPDNEMPLPVRAQALRLTRALWPPLARDT